MGLAASQARFLCITARKADCQYQSTDLAQQKLEITNQLSSISNDYANAMNATKLMWSNDAIDGDMGLTYSLLMMPSAANDYDPYMLTTSSGAIVLNSEYAAAAKAAGISKGGGIGSQEQRDKFIQSLVPEGLLTQDTANNITVYDYNAVNDVSNVEANTGVAWNAFAGLGAEPKNKAIVEGMQLSDLILSETIGQVTIDWAQMIKGSGQITNQEYDATLTNYNNLITDANKKIISQDLVDQLQTDKLNYEKDKNAEDLANDNTYKTICNNLTNAENILNGVLTTGSNTTIKAWEGILEQLESDKDTFQDTYGEGKTNVISTNATHSVKNNEGKLVTESWFNTAGSTEIQAGYNISVNGVIKSSGSFSDLTIGDLLTSDILITQTCTGESKYGSKTETSFNNFKNAVSALFLDIIKNLGYSEDGIVTDQGLNVDEASAEALQFAKMMVDNIFSRMENVGGQTDATTTVNSAFKNASNYNRYCAAVNGSEYNTYSVSLSNMLSAFLTYYDNSLNGANTNYVVGKTLETSALVTDDANYYYIAQDDPDASTSVTERNADFYDELYNNILAHGWREDSAIDDSEYLESMIKDGKYNISSLNQNDGYFYQNRYNETGYIVEVSDTDAIARAEAEFTAKKAELTYKEDAIDLKTKKLDAEITALSTEYDTVKTLISNSIQKTFQMFQS